MFFFFFLIFIHLAQLVKEHACLPMQEIQETQVRSLGLQDSLEREMATHFSILVREIPWTDEHTHTHTHTLYLFGCAGSYPDQGLNLGPLH